MRFKNLNREDKKAIKNAYNNREIPWEQQAAVLGTQYSVSERTIRRWAVRMGLKEKTDTVSEHYEMAKEKSHDKTKKRFLISFGQANVPVHKQFLNNIEAYAEYIGAEILIIAGKAPSKTKKNKKELWAEEILPYLDANRHDIHKYVSILSDVRIPLTATDPMSGLAGLTGVNSCIIGSPKVQMEVIGALEGHQPKLMLTTGAVTKKAYGQSKAEKKAEFHHVYGAVIIEIASPTKFHARQITATDDGNFQDLIYEVKDGKVHKSNEVEGIILADLHLGETDEKAMNATIDLMNKLKPKHTLIHDLFEGYSISHHTLKNPIETYRKMVNGKDSLKKEIDYMLAWLNRMRKYNLVIVRSNHDHFVDRYLENSNWKDNLQNSVEYMEYCKVLLEGKAPKGIIPYIIDKNFKDIKTLGRLDSFKVSGVECGVHGDLGQNGSFATLSQFRRLNSKICIGHSHTPGRKDGALQVGTMSKLRMYNLGISTWMHSSVLIFKSGKMQHVNIIDGEYTTFK